MPIAQAALGARVVERQSSVGEHAAELLRLIGGVAERFGGEVAPRFYKPETIQRFQARIREAFLSGERAIARVYLNTLVERMSVTDEEIIIDARAGAELAMMAEPRKAHPESTSGEVLADVVGWRTP